MKIKTVEKNNRKKQYEIVTEKGDNYIFPYSQQQPNPSQGNKIVKLFVDPELGCEGFTYFLEDGGEGSILMDYILHYNRDPAYMRDMLLYELSVEAQDQIKKSKLSKREIIRRLNTSPAQFYRLVDQTNYTKSVDQMLNLLQALDCEVEFIIHDNSA